MSVFIEKKDLRSTKTERALNTAMFSLLEKRNFGEITVSDICEEALISRATFYAHYIDKYDFLKAWLLSLKPENMNKDAPYNIIEKTVNQFVHKNASVLKNLICNANDETLVILFDFILPLSNFAVENNIDGKINPKYVVLSNFFAGGMHSYLLWLVKNKFQSDVEPMNTYIYEIIEKFQEWNA